MGAGNGEKEGEGGEERGGKAITYDWVATSWDSYLYLYLYLYRVSLKKTLKLYPSRIQMKDENKKSTFF